MTEYFPLSLLWVGKLTTPLEAKLLIYDTIMQGVDAKIAFKNGSAVSVDIKALPESGAFKFQLLKDNGAPGFVFQEHIKYLLFASEKLRRVILLDRAKVQAILDARKDEYSLVPGATRCVLYNVGYQGYGQLRMDAPLSLWWVVMRQSLVQEAILWDLTIPKGA